jgi:hypothetical protein
VQWDQIDPGEFSDEEVNAPGALNQQQQPAAAGELTAVGYN